MDSVAAARAPWMTLEFGPRYAACDQRAHVPFFGQVQPQARYSEQWLDSLPVILIPGRQGKGLVSLIDTAQFRGLLRIVQQKHRKVRQCRSRFYIL